MDTYPDGCDLLITTIEYSASSRSITTELKKILQSVAGCFEADRSLARQRKV